jgi:chemotaxis signal transduction protein
MELEPGGRALRQENLIQIIADPAIAPISGAGECWRGLANLRGGLIGVADLGVLLDGRPTDGGVMVAIASGAGDFGLLCEGVRGPRELPAPDALPDEPLEGDPAWLLPAPPGEPRIIDIPLLLEDERLKGRP